METVSGDMDWLYLNSERFVLQLAGTTGFWTVSIVYHS